MAARGAWFRGPERVEGLAYRVFVKHETRGKLEAAGSAGSDGTGVADGSDAPERRRRREVHVGLSELRVIEQVEGFHTERQAGPFADLYGPRQRGIDLEKTGAV